MFENTKLYVVVPVETICLFLRIKCINFQEVGRGEGGGGRCGINLFALMVKMPSFECTWMYNMKNRILYLPLPYFSLFSSPLFLSSNSDNGSISRVREI